MRLAMTSAIVSVTIWCVDPKQILGANSTDAVVTNAFADNVISATFLPLAYIGTASSQ